MESRKHRVLFLGPTPPPLHGQAIANELFLDSGIREEVRLVHLNVRFARNLEDVGQLRLGKFLLLICYCIQLLYQLLLFRPQIVVLEPAFYAAPFQKDAIFVLICRLFNVRIVLWFHMHFSALRYAAKSPTFQRFVRRVLGFGDAFVANSWAVLDSVPLEIANPLLRRPVYHYVSSGTIRTIHIRKDRYRVVYLSNMISAKGWKIALRAAELICQERSDVVFEFYGGTVAQEPRAEVEDMFSRVKAPEQILYKGSIEGEEKWEVLANSDIFLFPTNYAPEGLSLVVVEAMAVGLPVITTSVGGLPEAITHNDGGVVVPAMEAEAIADAIRVLLADPELRQRMGQRNLERVEYQHTRHAHRTAWVQLFNDLLALEPQR